MRLPLGIHFSHSIGLGTVSGARVQVMLCVAQDGMALSALNKLDLAACLGQEGVDEPMTQEQFLAQTPARCVILVGNPGL